MLIGITVLALMLWEPHLEGRNVNATPFEIYFTDPFLAYAYTASVAFFVALYQAFKVVGYVRQGTIFGEATVKALRTIKYCGMILVATIMGAQAYIAIIVRGTDDIAGGIAVSLFLMIIAAMIAIAAGRFERMLKYVVGTKSSPKGSESLPTIRTAQGHQQK
ncbi:MAG: hypothetical protein RL141_201 [Candidatus Parcubacteria bacterium]